MVESDTIKLLRECDAGAKMGIKSISDVIDQVKSDEFKRILNDNKYEHEKLENEIQEELIRFKDDGKDPNPIAVGMSWMKTSLKIGIENSDKTIADVMTDGCNMGVKSLNSYLNKYGAADEKSKSLTKKLICTEENMAEAMKAFL